MKNYVPVELQQLRGSKSPETLKLDKLRNAFKVLDVDTNNEAPEVTETTSSGVNDTDQKDFIAMQYPSNISHLPSMFFLRAVEINTASQAYYGDMRNAFTQQDAAINNNDPDFGELVVSMMLPIPESFNDNIKHSVDGSTDTLAGESYKAALAAGVSLSDNGSAVDKIRGLGDIGKSFLSSALGLAQRGAIQGNAEQAILNASNRVLGDISTTSYKGTGLRQLTLAYKFMPQTVGELKGVANIINAFKLFSMARKNSTNTLETYDGNAYESASKLNLLHAPPVWFIQEINLAKGSRFTNLFNMGPCAISAVNVNNTPDNLYKTFVGTAGDPVSIEVSVTFEELIPMYQETYKADMERTSKVNSNGMVT
ncbi:baseplate tail-tube junction protein [Aliivibrio sp. S4TY2]|uniref:baseplate tail-tube junction protein n=1 Tax=unclassified Aliivibrio TaxID=2645654 RepID=UPI0023787C0E|nr:MULTISPECIES: baseplate tail-tube junction protein [unclassified Aliivibrio]MDD9158044.1 baseplate tail-tube junction protein [Aliivibrio sp. S4TY2]MDD9161913.1 baseplate tail-tube junction protein [Aliivibrio sp. S4TY1]MDD9166041.1 baseplate tail-tube junction protein [Aliivibrio sp. S4MY2]MDD9169993.1 baseplate tail-tube junction protein [Aliivibrio sp. S4MY4]MDD9187044.1 baseplate tail-tube junction protein [Aliivibrio sp. S4MY3]